MTVAREFYNGDNLSIEMAVGGKEPVVRWLARRRAGCWVMGLDVVGARGGRCIGVGDLVNGKNGGV